MFDKPFPFTKLFSKDLKNKGGYLTSKSTYSFRTESSVDYLIEVEEYHHDIYIIKFCQKKLKKHPKRFNVLTGECIMPKIVATCIQVMLQLLKKNPLANFGFLGSNTIIFGTGPNEPKEETKRFKIYRYAIVNLISEDVFVHHWDTKNSTYLVVNKKHENTDDIKEKANKMFDLLFPNLRD